MELLHDGPRDAPTLILGHGAGAGMRSSGMQALAAALAAAGLHVIRYEFPYMAARADGRRPPTPRADRSIPDLVRVLDVVDAPGPVAIGGRSYGGRVATMAAQDLHDAGRIGGVVCFGYPFHPPSKPHELRTAHLQDYDVPTLICQGTRDEFGTRDEVAGYALSPAISIHWLEDGDHGLVPRKAVSGRTAKQNLAEAADATAAFARSLG